MMFWSDFTNGISILCLDYFQTDHSPFLLQLIRLLRVSTSVAWSPTRPSWHEYWPAMSSLPKSTPPMLAQAPSRPWVEKLFKVPPRELATTSRWPSPLDKLLLMSSRLTLRHQTESFMFLIKFFKKYLSSMVVASGRMEVLT